MRAGKGGMGSDQMARLRGGVRGKPQSKEWKTLALLPGLKSSRHTAHDVASFTVFTARPSRASLLAGGGPVHNGSCYTTESVQTEAR